MKIPPVNSTLDLQSNDTDLDGDALSVDPKSVGTFSTTQGGTIIIAADGSYSYTPAANFNGTDTFEYTVTDGKLTDIGKLSITVNPVNDAPVAVDDVNSTDEDTPVNSTLDLQSNDTDLDGDALSVDPKSVGTFSTTQGGTIIIAADGSYSYTPAANFNGTDTFEYTVTDGKLTDIGKLSITVNPVNDAPVAVDDVNSTDEDTPVNSTLDLQSNDTDLDGDALSVDPKSVGTFSTTQGGTIIIAADGSYSYTPAANFNGTDTFEYTVTDGKLTDIGKLSITVNPVNDAPVAVDDVNSTDEDTPVNSTLDLQSNDTDLDGDALSVDPKSVGTFSTTQGGTIIIAADGSYSYTPAANFNGTDTFEYTVTDGKLTDIGKLSITVNPVNDAPVAVDDVNSTDEDTPVNSTLDLQSNDTDLDGDALSVDPKSVGTFSTTQGGTIIIAADGSYSYTPAANFNGTDTFEYTVTDGKLTDIGKLSITVNPVNDAPVAVDDVNSTDEDTPVNSTLDLQSNDTDLDGDALSVDPKSVGTFSTTQGGTIIIAADGSYSYTPAANFNGTDTFEYTVTDGKLTDIGKLSITVNPVNDAPVAVDDVNSTDEDTPVNSTLDLQSNDTDLDGDALSVDPKSVGTFSTTQGGTIIIAADGSYSYTPAANFNGTDTFEYTVTDGKLTDIGKLSITVNPVNDAPVAVDDVNSTDEDTPVNSTLDLQSNDTDLDGDALSVDPKSVGTFSTTQGGTIIIAADGSYSYTPAANFNGTDTFEYTVTDGKLTDIGKLSITVNPVNDAPVAVDDVNSTDEDTPVNSTLDLQSNDTDLDGDALSVDPKSVGTFSTTQGGTIIIAADGSYSYTPAANFNGTDTFEYTVTDGKLTDIGKLSITVNPVNDAPVAVDDVNSTDEDTPVNSTLDLQSNDTDLDGDALSVDPKSVGTFSTTQGGTIIIAADGSYSYTPAANFNGTDTFEYTVTDGKLTDIGKLSITVNPVNDAPVAVDDVNSTDEDTPVNSTLDLQSNDTDLDGDALSVDPKSVGTFSTTQGGTIIIAADGSYSYTPAANFNGTDTFEYTVTDGKLTDIGKLSITVNPVNDAPVAVDDFYNLDSGIVTGNIVKDLDSSGNTDSDPENDPLTVTQVNDTDLVFDSVTGFATVSIDGGTLSIKEDGSFSFLQTDGTTDAASFSYTLSDGTVGDEAKANVTLNSVDAVDDGAFTAVEVKLGSHGTNGWTAPDGVTITALGFTGAHAGVYDIANLEVNGNELGVKGSPRGGSYQGQKDQLEYNAANGESEGILFTFDNLINHVEFDVSRMLDSEAGRGEVGTWIAYNDGVEVDRGNFITDNKGSSLDHSFMIDTKNLVFNSLEFVAQPYAGLSAITGDGDSSDYFLTGLTATGPADANNGYQTSESQVLNITESLLDNDSDIEGDSFTISEVNGQQFTSGTPVLLASGAIVIVNADGTFSYNPDGKFDNLLTGEYAVDSFTYTIKDAFGATDTASVSITITGEGLALSLSDDTAATRPLEPVLIDVLDNDSGDGVTLTGVTVTGGNAVGLATIVDGKVVFTPSQTLITSPDTPDSVTLTYTATDSSGQVQSAMVTVDLGIYYDEADYAFESFVTDSVTDIPVTAMIDLTKTATSGEANLAATLYPDSPTTFQVAVTVDATVVEPLVDAYFLQDLTGSFSDDLSNLQGGGVNHISDMLAVFESESSDVAYGTGTFVDTSDGDGGNYHKQFEHGQDLVDLGDLSDNTTNVENIYDSYSASGGRDYPESQFYAIKEIAEAIIAANGGNEQLGVEASSDPSKTLGFRQDSSPVVVLSTDAVSHGYLADNTTLFGTDPNLSGILEFYAFVEASGMQLVVLAADLYRGNAGAMNFWNDVFNGTVADVDSGVTYGGRVDGLSIYNYADSFTTGKSIDGHVAELSTDSSNIVQALQLAVDNIEIPPSLNLMTQVNVNESDENDYVDFTKVSLVDNGDGTFTQTWDVTVEAPVGGPDDPNITLTITDKDGNAVGETLNLSATVADGGVVTGTDSYDTLIGSDTLDDTITGLDGNDYISGEGGQDSIDAGAGDDLIVLDSTDTHIDGGDGFDTLLIPDGVLIADGVLDFSNITNGTIANVEKLDLNASEVQNVSLTLDDVLDMTGTENVLELKGGVGDEVTINDNDWTLKDAKAGLFENDATKTQVKIVASDDADNHIKILTDDGTEIG